MVKRRKKEDGTCVFCGAVGEVTDDHVPPKNLFIGIPDDELIKVPSCWPCNTGTSKDDEYFRVFLIPQDAVASHPQAQKLNKRVREKFDETDHKGLEKRMYSQLHAKEVYTPAGIYLGRRDLIYPEYSRIDGTLKKILKGLFFHVMETPFPSGMFHAAVVDKSQIPELQQKLQLDLSFWLEGLDRGPLHDIRDVFSFKWAGSLGPRPPISVWLLTFFGKREFFGITYPRTLCNEIKLLDADPSEFTRSIL